METIIASFPKTQRLRGVHLAKKILESQRESHEKSIKALQDPNSDLSKAVKRLSK